MGQNQDTEITLGTGKLLALFFALVVICAVFFSLGFSMGRGSNKGATLIAEPSGTTLASSGANKASPARSEQTPVQTPAPLPVRQAQQKEENVPAAQSEPAPATATPAPEVAKGATGPGYIVQVAAVSKQEDAEALVNALRKKQYPVFVNSAVPGDSLFHVQIGPFAELKEAEDTRSKLVGDGYNPILKR